MNHSAVVIAFPAICAEMHIVQRDGVAVVNSRDVAAVFHKRHDHVMRDIAALELSPDLGASWFLPASYRDSLNREQSSMDMTRDGFTFLCMGWRGAKAAAIKVRYIQAFNAMEAALGSEHFRLQEMLEVAVERGASRALQPTHGIVVDMHDRTVRIEDYVSRLKHRVDFPEPVQRFVCKIVGPNALCLCCKERRITDADGKPIGQFDHFHGPQSQSIKNCWLVCRQCNIDLRDQEFHDRFEPRFKNFQLDVDLARKNGRWARRGITAPPEELDVPPTALTPTPTNDVPDNEPEVELEPSAAPKPPVKRTPKNDPRQHGMLL
jgi:Rha family phage regulatory protein